MAQGSNAAPGARVEHQADRRFDPGQMATNQMDSGRMPLEAVASGQMAAEQSELPPSHKVAIAPKVSKAPAAWAAFGTGTGAAIIFHDLASI